MSHLVMETSPNIIMVIDEDFEDPGMLRGHGKIFWYKNARR